MQQVRSDSSPVAQRPAVLGQDNLEVYTQIFGLSETEFIDLMEQGVFE